MVVEPLPDEIKIVMIKGVVPNFITARATISRLQAQENKRSEATGDSPRKVIYCQFCGCQQRSMQGLRAHLRFCRGKRAYQQAASDGVPFKVGGRPFIVAARSIKLYRGLEKFERDLNKKVHEGAWEPESAAIAFYSLILGAALTEPEECVKLIKHLKSTPVDRAGEPGTVEAPIVVDTAGDAQAVDAEQRITDVSQG